MAVNARQIKVGVNIATSGSWGTGTANATAVGAGDGHYVRDDVGLTLSRRHTVDDSAGQSFIGSVQAAHHEAIQTALPMFLHFNDAFQNVLWALTLGTGGTSPTQVGTTTAYMNTFAPATNKTGRYATVVRDVSQQIQEVSGAKFTGFTLTFDGTGRATIDWQFTGDTVKWDSTTNTSTQTAALTFPTLGLRAHQHQANLRLNAQSGAALQASDSVPFTSLSVRFSQPLDVIYTGNQVTIIEPEESGHPEIMVEVAMPRFDSATDDYFAAHRDVTFYKGDVTFTGPTLATTTYGLLLQFPNLEVQTYQVPVPGGAGQLQPRMTLRALSTTTAPTGMTGVTTPLRVTTTGVSTTNPFA